jgi:hypothetical protein
MGDDGKRGLQQKRREIAGTGGEQAAQRRPDRQADLVGALIGGEVPHPAGRGSEIDRRT